ncbi:MAG: sialate O-acetylesterase [Limisphaerales bacterium]
MPLLRPAIAVLFTLAAAHADVKLPPVFSDHMVLQRDLAAPVWGTAAPDEEVTVSIAGQTKSTKADAQGKWRVKLDPLKVGDPLTLTVKGKNTLTISDVLVGEVWVGSGQSNMDGRVSGYAKGDEVLAELAKKSFPQIRHINSRGTWQIATPQASGGFGALLYPFGIRLHEELKVPVGLMLGAVGGTPSGYWLSEEMYAADAACKAVVAEFAKTYSPEAQQKKFTEELAAWEKASEVAKKDGKPAPRKPTPAGKPGETTTGAKIGNLFEAHIRGYVGYGIRGVLWDQGESGTAVVGVDQYTLMGALIKGWRKDWAQGEFPFLYIQKPSGNGCAWDTDSPVTKNASKFAPLPATVPNDGGYRELHVRIQRHPNTALVTASDLGSGVHPTNKSGYGARASQVALGMVYGRKVETQGPLLASHTIEGGKVRLKFTHVGKGLAARHSEKLQGFIIAGDDKKFVWADAVIEGDSIVVSSDKVPKPAAVRYAWASAHPWANLFNQDGLPAQSFRTDDWK